MLFGFVIYSLFKNNNEDNLEENANCIY